jgi:hypothetical protein
MKASKAFKIVERSKKHLIRPFSPQSDTLRYSHDRNERVLPTGKITGGLVKNKQIIYTYIRMIHYKLFNIILFTYKMFISSINYQLSYYPSITKSPLHHTT